MIKTATLLFTAIFTAIAAFAQNQQFSIDDVIPGGKNYASFVPKTIKSMQWIPDECKYSFISGDSLLCTDIKTDKTELIFTLKELSQYLSDSSLKYVPTHKWINKQLIKISKSEKIIFFDTNSRTILDSILILPEAKNIDFSSDNQHIAYTIENNLYVGTSEIPNTAVSSDDDKGIINGQTYHRSEFGISKGTFWSNSGKLLAYARMDETMVGSYPLVNIEKREAEVENIKYPMAGMNSHQVTIGIYNCETSKTVFLKTGEPLDRYFTNISWSPDDKFIYIAEINREQNEMKMNCYDVSSGEFVKTLFHETDSTYTEPQHPMVWLQNKPDQFIWQSNRDGHNHLYLYNTSGALIKQITKGDWDVIDLLSIDSKAEYLYLISTEKSAIDRNLFKIDLKKNERRCLTPETGIHSISLSSNFKFAIDNWNSSTMPRKIDIIDTKSGNIKPLMTAKNPLANFNLGEANIFTIKADDNITDLYCRMIKPINFDSTKRYPVIVYVYGGPHAQLVTNSWSDGTRSWQQFMAQKGYVSFVVDNRGSANRGKAFENIIHRQLGKVEMADQMKGIEYLKKLSFIDSTRIGVHGWSYGGYMTISLMTHFPETFKVGVAGGPVIDWKYYEIMYGERYMDTPQENPQGYADCSLLNQAKYLNGRLLIIHGAIDPVVVWQHSLSFVQKCIELNKPVDYFVYPRHEHNVIGRDRVHLMSKVTTYFDDFL